MKNQSEVVSNRLMAFYTDDALAFYEKNMHNKDHLDLAEGIHMARTCNNIAELYRGMGYQSEALNFFKQAAFIGRLVEPCHLVVAWACSNMGHLYRKQGKLDKALENYQATVSPP